LERICRQQPTVDPHDRTSNAQVRVIEMLFAWSPRDNRVVPGYVDFA
jgi:hypothetical protein